MAKINERNDIQKTTQKHNKRREHGCEPKQKTKDAAGGRAG